MTQPTVQDLAMFKVHKEQFISPLRTMMAISKLNLSQADLIRHKDFNRVIFELHEIQKQGLKSQFLQFVNIIMSD